MPSGQESSLPINVINIGASGSTSDPMSVATSPNPALESVQIQPRFEGIRESIETLVVEVVKEQFNRRQGTDNITRNFIKFLTTACGLLEIRHLVVPKLEMWIMTENTDYFPWYEIEMTDDYDCHENITNDAGKMTGVDLHY